MLMNTFQKKDRAGGASRVGIADRHAVIGSHGSDDAVQAGFGESLWNVLLE
jgi:hypothetical protein